MQSTNTHHLFFLGFVLWTGLLLSGCATTPGPKLNSQERCMADAIHGEARGEPFEGKVFVGRVILTRLNQSYGSSICEIVHAPSQFAPQKGYSEDTALATKKALQLGANGITHFHSYKRRQTPNASFSQSAKCLYKGKVGAHWGFFCNDRSPASVP